MWMIWRFITLVLCRTFRRVLKVCQKVHWILRRLRPHASHIPFEVRRRLLVFLIMPHIGYGGIVYAGADAATQRRLNTCLRYIHSLMRLDHVSHLETSVMGALLAYYSRIQLLSFIYKVLHVWHPCYLFSLYLFASSARTRNLKYKKKSASYIA
jgi:hypothetical protein